MIIGCATRPDLSPAQKTGISESTNPKQDVFQTTYQKCRELPRYAPNAQDAYCYCIANLTMTDIPINDVDSSKAEIIQQRIDIETHCRRATERLIKSGTIKN